MSRIPSCVATNRTTPSGTSETADAGDVLVAAEVSRLARSTLQVLELLQVAAERGVTVHIAKNRMVLDDRRAQIVDYLNKGVSKRSVAKILGCSPTTLYSWIRRRRISGRIAIHALSVYSCSIATQTPDAPVWVTSGLIVRPFQSEDACRTACSPHRQIVGGC